ncbi:MAG TPA: pilus assembly protein PilM, partial [Clostridia bacterium]|nr:pilus assembly protein PilM [Clostridia bacterium]
MGKIYRLFANRGTFVAVDLGSTAIKIAKIRYSNDEAAIRELYKFPIPEGMLSSWLSGEDDSLNGVLEKAVSDLNLKGNQVVTTLPGGKVITRHIQMPSMPNRELKRALKWEANRLIPIPLNDMTVRHVKLKEVLEGGVKKTNLLLIACSSELLYKYQETFKKAGLCISSIDLQNLALWRLFAEKQWQ